MKRVVCFVLTFSLISSLAFGQSLATSPDEDLSKPGGVLKIQLDDGRGTTGETRSAWIPVEQEKLLRSNVLDQIKQKKDDPPFAIFTLRSTRWQAEELSSELSKRHIRSEILEVPDELCNRWEDSLSKDSAKKSWSDLIIRPSRRDVILGLTQTAMRAAISLSWFSIGIPFWSAFAIASTMTTLTALFSINYKTVDNIFAQKFNLAGKVSRGNEIGRRMGFDLILSELYRGLSGPVKGAHSILSSEGQVEIGLNLISGSGGGSIFSATRNRVFATPETEYAKRWWSLDTFVPNSILNTLDFMGVHFKTLFSFYGFQLNLSTLLIFGNLLGLSLLIEHRPQFALKVARVQEEAFDKFVSMFDRLFKTGQTSECAATLKLL